MNKVDLMFIKDIIEGYKTGLQDDYKELCNPRIQFKKELNNKCEAADEILVLIQEFITEVNKL